MWFFAPLIMIYISLPFLSVFVVKAPKRLLDLFMILGLVLPTLSSILAPEHSENAYAIFGSGCLYFPIAGYYIHTFGLERQLRRKLYWAALLSTLLIYGGTFWLSLHCPDHYRYFLSYNILPCAVTALAVFTLFKYIHWESVLNRMRIPQALLAHLASLSLGIYLVQQFWFMTLIHFHLCDDSPLVRFPLMYLLCISSILALKHVPIIKSMV